MKRLEYFDKNDYASCTSRFKRNAVRAIIFKEGKLAMIKSNTFGEYKFPGGGVQDQESHLDALIRETIEETGLVIKASSVKPYGYMKEKRRSTMNTDDMFEMDSFYYVCEVEDHSLNTHMDDYEIEYGYQLEYVTIEDAIAHNVQALKHQDIATWIQRELKVLELLKKEKNDIV
jgi:8-oxo-dGTP pyrophosphatase MutT (NUDIX family)